MRFFLHISVLLGTLGLGLQAKALLCEAFINWNSKHQWVDVNRFIQKQILAEGEHLDSSTRVFSQELIKTHIHDGLYDPTFFYQLGFRGNPDGRITSTPHISVLSSNFSRLVEEARVDHNSRNPRDLIIPEELIRKIGFPFYNRAKEDWIVLEYGEPIPPGYYLRSDKYPPAKVLYPSLERGIFPIDPSFFITHDFRGHLTSYFRYLEYNRAYRNLAQFIVEKGGWKYFESEGSHQYIRVFFYNESLVLIDRARFQKFIELTRLSDPIVRALEGGGSYLYDWKYYERALSKLSDSDFIDFLKIFTKVYPSIVQSMGGGSADGMRTSDPFYHMLNVAIDRLEYKIEDLYPGENNRLTVLRYETALVLNLFVVLANTNSTLWAQEIMSNKPNRRHLATRAFKLMTLLLYDDGNASGNYHFNLLREAHESP